MNDGFIRGDSLIRDRFEWGTVDWRCRGANTGSSQIVVFEVTLDPGQAHDFHRHPEQEEFITIQQGTVTQFLDDESTVLVAGDSVYVAADTVHATFNVSDEPAKVFVVISPAKGVDSYEVVDVSGDEPWASVRRPESADRQEEGNH
ncbi:cupin domain-containing protein [Rhodococcoides fascians]|uniref:cupin domain-containing protein n=1 Tax=Rhodococcoides fascians TaxID=1828 RepID=UPI0005601CDA|nr:cupin domain-containing protein [Rhodococcus fascians]